LSRWGDDWNLALKRHAQNPQVLSISRVFIQLINPKLFESNAFIFDIPIPLVVEASYDFRREVGISDAVRFHHPTAQLLGKLVAFRIHEVDEKFPDLAELLRFPEASGVDLVFCGWHEAVWIETFGL
jgi:hypothetical protein